MATRSRPHAPLSMSPRPAAAPPDPLADQKLLEDLQALVADAEAEAASMRPSTRRAFARLRARVERLREEAALRHGPVTMVGTSRGFQGVLSQARALAARPGAVAISGEDGSGRQRLARLIHDVGATAGGPFVAMDGSRIPSDAVDAALFGVETGANGQPVAFVEAEGGTLLLERVDELPASTQARIERFIRTGTLTPVGAADPRSARLRLIVTLGAPTSARAREGALRPALADALAERALHVPPLRERMADVIPLADHFVSVYNRLHLRQVRRIATSALDMLAAYHWPGNVRELETCIERAVLLSTDDVIHGHNLPPSLQTAEHSGTRFDGALPARLAAVEREIILDALKSCHGNMAAAARALGVTERVMGLRVKSLAIDRARFRRRD